jgi:DNA sulfur modification protein DndD
MIFRQLQLNNFRVFNGSHDIDLTPRKEGLLNRPIVLFGGLNGAGKTTILSAVRLVLLGRRASTSVMNNKEFHTYLIEQINQTALNIDKDANASIALEFTHTHQGIHKLYRVTREWNKNKGDQLVLYENAQLQDHMNNEQVQSFLFDIVPPSVGELFFFDGEKIAELAEDDTGTYLKEAVQKLLGIDIVERLKEDVNIFLKQEQNQHKESERQTLDTQSLEKEKVALKSEGSKAAALASQIKSQIADEQRIIQGIEESIAARGGEWAKTHEDEKARFLDSEKEIAVEKSKLLQALDGNFPLALAPNAMKGLIDELQQEQAFKQISAFNAQLPQHYRELAKTLAIETGGSSDALEQAIERYFSSQGNICHAQRLTLDVSDSDFYTIKGQIADSMQSKSHLHTTSEQLENLEHEQKKLEQNLGKAPTEEELKALYEKLRKHEKSKTKQELERKNALLEARDNFTKALELTKKLEKHYKNQKTATSLKKAKQRVDAANNTLVAFSARLTELRVKQLEALFVTSYRKLARKGDVKLSASINPKSFDVSLIDNEGLVINRKLLSAGEKQIFAFAILEALGKLSGRVLPVIVDTPLGRLDSHHRDRLVKHYFPEAAEQVILLSTDTEVDETFFKDMAHEISHGFEINFDQKSRCSQVTEGYFWEKNDKGVA